MRCARTVDPASTSANTMPTTSLGREVLMWPLDRAHYADMGVALWWAIQTVTTVGYGGCGTCRSHGAGGGGPRHARGARVVAIITASITSIFMEARQSQRGEVRDAAEDAYGERLLAQLAAIEARLAVFEGDRAWR
jgi:voltage-gated potassium channel